MAIANAARTLRVPHAELVCSRIASRMGKVQAGQ